MTVIAWDGTTLAADRKAVNNYVVGKTTKIFRLGDNRLVGMSGDYDCCMALQWWLNHGGDVEKWPASQATDGWAKAMVICDNGTVYYYERQPYRLFINLPFHAIGSGRECAIGAMAMGADAVRAVKIASELIDGCGGGVDTLTL